MTSPSFVRHGAFCGPANLNSTLNIIGVGAVGSRIGIIAANMGFTRFRVFDHDKVEAHNLPNQIYLPKHVGVPKVDAFEEVLRDFNADIKVEKHEKYCTGADKDLIEGILVLGVDTMAARKELFEIFNMNLSVDYVFEVGLAFTLGVVNTINPLDFTRLQEWRNLLKTDEEVSDGPCNQRLCATLVSIVTGYTVHEICRKVVDDEYAPPKRITFDITNELNVYTQ